MVAGYSRNGSYDDFALVRYNASGSLDTSFGAGGMVTTGIGTRHDQGQSIAIQTDGKIVVVGYGYGSNNDFAVVRYNADGSLDTSFDGDGKVTTAIGTALDTGQSVALQSDGKIVVAGTSYNGSNNDIALVRYNTDGSLDTSFDGDGKVITNVAGQTDKGSGVVIQSDGKIVVAGTGNDDIAVVRYNADGSLDTSFDGDGKVTTAIGSGTDVGTSVALQSDGKIVVAGYSDSGSNFDLAVVRYNTDGSLDTSFDADGKVTTAIGPGNDLGRGVVLQSDGKILVAGSADNATNTDFALVRYNADGSLDTSFGGSGEVTTGVGSSTDIGQSVALQSDGRIVVAGVCFSGSTHDFAVVRYIGDIATPAEITVSGNGVSIADGDTTPSTENGTDFQLVAQGGAPVSRVFTVRNDGRRAADVGRGDGSGGLHPDGGPISYFGAGGLGYIHDSVGYGDRRNQNRRGLVRHE